MTTLERYHRIKVNTLQTNERFIHCKIRDGKEIANDQPLFFVDTQQHKQKHLWKTISTLNKFGVICG